MSNAERVRRDFVLEGSCKRCPRSLEDVDHIFHGCEVADAVWKKFLPLTIISSLFNLNFDNLIRTNLIGQFTSNFTNYCSPLFEVILWKEQKRFQ